MPVGRRQLPGKRGAVIIVDGKTVYTELGELVSPTLFVTGLADSPNRNLILI